MTNTIFNECIDLVKNAAGHEYLYFDTAVQVKLTPHSYPFQAWAVCVSPKDELYVMDSDEQWHQLTISDNPAHLMIGSLYQRLSTMRTQYAKAS